MPMWWVMARDQWVMRVDAHSSVTRVRKIRAGVLR
jgi:hypothetical protein